MSTIDTTSHPQPITPQSGPSLKSLAMRGSFWSVGSQVVNNGIRLVGNMVLTRLLVPEAFGLMLLVGVFTAGLKMFTDLGINQNIVQAHRGDDPVFLNTAWTLSVLRGVFLWLIACLFTWPYAMFYNEPQLLMLVPAVSFSALISGFASTRLATLNRKLALGRVCLIEFLAQVANLTATVGYALIWPNVWALVAGAIAFTSTRTLLSHFAISGHKVWFAWDKDAVSSLFRFGQWIFISTILTFLARQADKILLGKLISNDLLGVYGIALTWAIVPAEVLERVANQVAFPVFSKLKTSPKGLSSSEAARVRRPLSILGGMIATMLIVGGDHLIHFLYDDRYAEAGWMLQLLGVGVWFQMLGNSYSPAILALGNTKWLAAGHLSKLLSLLVAVPLGFYYYGIGGVLCGVAFCEMAKYSVFAFAMYRYKLSQIRDDIGFTVFIAFSVGVYYQFKNMVELQPLTLAIASVLVTLVCWSPFSMSVVRMLRRKKTALK